MGSSQGVSRRSWYFFDICLHKWEKDTSSIRGKMLANAMYTAWLTGSAISKYCQLIKVPGIKPKVLTLV